MKKSICIGRAINGITINGLEFILDENNEVMLFHSINEAKGFLLDNGIPKDSLDYFEYKSHEG